MTSLLFTLLALLPIQDQDEKKSSRQIFIEAQRLETISKEYDKAVQKYNVAKDKAVNEERCRSLLVVFMVGEKMSQHQ